MTHLKLIVLKTLSCFFVLSIVCSLAAQGTVKIIGDANDGGFGELKVIGGNVYACGISLDASGTYRAVLAQYTLDGDRVWETILTDVPNSSFSDFAIMPNGDIYVVGNTRTNLNDQQTLSGLIARFSAGGALLSARTYPFPGRDYIRRILPKPNGTGLIAIGQDNRGGTGISDVGLIYDIDPNTLNVTLLQHAANNGDSQWARGIFFTAAGDLLFYGDVPSLNGDAGIAVADANGIINNTNYRLRTPGSNLLAPEQFAEQSGNLYFTGGVNNPGIGFLASVDASFAYRWAYSLPQFSRLEDITTPDAAGVFHTVAHGWAGTTQSVLLKLQEVAGGIQLLTAARLLDGATDYRSVADIDIDGNYLYYTQIGNNLPDGFGGTDAVFAKLDLDYNSCITEFIPLEEIILERTELIIEPTELEQVQIEAPFEQYEAHEVLEWDQFNLCCGSLVFAEPPYTYDCAPAPTYTFTFDIANYTTVPVTSVLIKNDVDPTQNVFLNLTASPILPGGVLTGQQFTLVLSGPLTGPQQVCFDVIFLTDGEECCHFEQCIEILPPDPCESISVNYEQIYDGVEEGECCYDLQLVNDFCEEYFLNVTTEILTPGVTFTNFNSTLLNATINGSETEIVWDNPGGFLPLGPLDDMSFCLGNIGSTSQVPQEVAVHWFANDPVTGQATIVCSDTLVVECQPCMILEDEELVCDPNTGNAVYNFTVTNMSSYQIEDIVLESQTPGINIIPPFIPVNLAPAAPPTPGGAYTGSVQFENTGGWPPGTVVQFRVVLLAADGWCCHLEVEAVIPDCTDQNVNCDCTDVEGFEEILSGQAGLSHTVNCNNGTITLATNTLTECERTRWVLNYPGQELLVEQFGIGNQPVTFEILANGEYQLLLEVVRYDDNGEPCPELPVSSIEYLFVVDCVNIVVDEDPDEEVDIDWPPAVQLQPLQTTTSGKTGFWVYPSPVVQTLNLSLESEGRYQIEVFTVSGMPIQTYGLDWEKGQVEKIDVRAWPAGIYYLKATSSEGQVYQTRFVKQ